VGPETAVLEIGERESPPAPERRVNRICVLGCPGAGKSRLAARLSAMTSLPVISLDRQYWQAGWEPLCEGEWQREHESLACGTRWIIDGNYTGTMDVRLALADVAIYLDVPRYLCLLRVVLRTLRFWRRVRPDGPFGCRERFDRDFFSYIWNFRRAHHTRIMATLAKRSKTCRVFVIRTEQDYADLLDILSVSADLCR
jgi:adenylate kinase family enzyme